MRYGHNCFSKEVCATSSGHVYPCIMERDVSLGQFLGSSLQEVLASETSETVRRRGKDHVKGCRDCEYRYVCFDCRPKAKGFAGGDFYAKPAYCGYDPHHGVWAQAPEQVEALLPILGQPRAGLHPQTS